MKTLSDWVGSEWQGRGELWLDPLGNQVDECDCSLRIVANGLEYSWSHDGKTHEGTVTLGEGDAQFQDSFHQKDEPMTCHRLDARGLFQVEGSYGPDGEWGWRIGLFHRGPTGEMVLQMTNIAPWGEEARAVRMTLSAS